MKFSVCGKRTETPKRTQMQVEHANSMQKVQGRGLNLWPTCCEAAAQTTARETVPKTLMRSVVRLLVSDVEDQLIQSQPCQYSAVKSCGHPWCNIMNPVNKCAGCCVDRGHRWKVKCIVVHHQHKSVRKFAFFYDHTKQKPVQIKKQWTNNWPMWDPRGVVWVGDLKLRIVCPLSRMWAN